MPKEQQAYKLGFDCPVDISSMPKCDGGYACSQCDKKVFDYSKMSYPEFLEAREKNDTASTCGIYNGHQLEGVYGNWRDKVTAAYRKSLLRAHKKRSLSIFVPLFAAALFLTGCGAHYCGMTYDDYDRSTQNDYKPATNQKSTIDTKEQERLKEEKRLREKKRKAMEIEANKGLNDIAKGK